MIIKLHSLSENNNQNFSPAKRCLVVLGVVLSLQQETKKKNKETKFK
jgi:hypothetical protein